MTGSSHRIEAIYVAFEQLDDVDTIADAIEDEGARLLDIDTDIDLEYGPTGGIVRPAAVFTFRGEGGADLCGMLAAVAALPCVWSAGELRRFSPSLPGRSRGAARRRSGGERPCPGPAWG